MIFRKNYILFQYPRQYLQAGPGVHEQKLEDEKIIEIDLNNKMKIRTDAEQEASKQTGLENALKYAPASRVEERKAYYQHSPDLSYINRLLHYFLFDLSLHR